MNSAIGRAPFLLSLIGALFTLQSCASAVVPMSVPGQFPAGESKIQLTTVDRMSGGPCSVSLDGAVWYELASGAQPPIDLTMLKCQSAAVLDSKITPSVPKWAQNTSGTQAIFVATSLQEAYSAQGMQAISALAGAAGIPVTWMIGNPSYITNLAASYNALHSSRGDDVELEDNSELYSLASSNFPWFSPAVSVEGAGRERNVAELLERGNAGFWGLTWNSHGTDNTSDEGAPWGTFCSDESSYKRPARSDSCALVAFEWTARDLTRAYLADTGDRGYSAEAAFSTDPDDVIARAGFDESAGAAYERSLVDAYAAAGVSQPLVMVSQQESLDEASSQNADDPLLGALYDEAKHVGMKPMTLREALPLAQTFSSRPRAIAFPFISGGQVTEYNGVPFTPATIDFHDNLAGMTFIAGHSLPSRVFTYALDPVSVYNEPLVATLPTSPAFPKLLGVTLTHGNLAFSFEASEALHFGVALWSDPASLELSGLNVFPAGQAGVVVTFDLPAGMSTQFVPCGACTSTTLPYSQ